MNQPAPYPIQQEVSEKGHISEPFSEYLSKKEYVSASELKQLRISPRHYFHYISDKEEQEKENRILVVSSAIHSLLIDKDKFKSEYACLKNSMLPITNAMGQKDYRNKANKEFRDVTFPSMCIGKAILTEPEYDMVIAVCKSASEHPTIKKLFSSGTAGLSMYKKDEKTGLMMKGRTSWLPDNINSILDIKTCMDSSPRAFTNKVFSMGYNLESVHYLNLFDREKFIFIACEENNPHTTEVYELDKKVLTVSKDEYRMLIDILWFCKKTKYYFSYTDFETIKEIYREHMLYDKDKDKVYDSLGLFFNIKHDSHLITTPSWMANK